MLDFDKIQEVASLEMKNNLNLSEPGNLRISISKAIAAAIKEYDAQKQIKSSGE